MAIGTPVTIYSAPATVLSSGVASGAVTQNVSARTLVVVICAMNVTSDYPNSLTDTAGNTYTLATRTTVSGATYYNTGIFYCVITNALVSGSTKFTPVSNGGGAFYGLAAVSVTGCTGGADVGVPINQTGTSTTLSPALSTGTLAVANELLVTAIEWSSGRAGYTEDAQFTNIAGIAINGFITCYKIVSATTAVTYAPTWTSGSVGVTACVASFKITPQYGKSLNVLLRR